MRFRDLRAVTFDCWGTLIFERTSRAVDGRAAFEVRVAAVARVGGVTLERAREVLTAAWQRHFEAWQALECFGSPGMAGFCLESLGGVDPERLAALTTALEDAALEIGVEAVPGAAGALTAIKERGLRTGLVCDTGFTPGRVVRRLLAGAGLLDLLDALAFSDEVGAPKPDARMFRAALDGVEPRAAVHVGDLRRTDVAGARAAGMGTVRFLGIYDDASDHPDADIVIDRMEELLAALADRPGARLEMRRDESSGYR